MSEVVSKIILDVAKNISRDYIFAKQGDRASRFLEIELQNNGEKVEIPSTAKVYLNAIKQDGKATKTVGTVLEDGSIKVRLTNQTLAVDGLVNCDVSIDNVDSKLTSLKFVVSVEPSTVSDDVIISTDEFTDLDEMVTRVDELETTVTSNESQRVENETVHKEAEAKRVAENIVVKNLINSFEGNMPMATGVTPGAIKAGGDIELKSPGIATVPGLKDKANVNDVYDRKTIDDKFSSMFLCGQVNCASFNDGGASITVALRYYKSIVFSKAFDVIPKVFLTQGSTSDGSGSIEFVISKVTKNGFEIRSNYAISELFINWLAIQ